MLKKLAVLLSVLVISLTTVVSAQPAAAAPPPYTVFGGVYTPETYGPGNFTLQSGAYQAIFQTDGNFVVYYINGTRRALWSSQTNGKGARRLDLQSDCNMVIYGYNNSVLWRSRTAGTCGQFYGRLVMQNDGNLVEYVYDRAGNNKAVWASNSVFH